MLGNPRTDQKRALQARTVSELRLSEAALKRQTPNLYTSASSSASIRRPSPAHASKSAVASTDNQGHPSGSVAHHQR
jgi:hypothetical protein